VHDLAFFEPVRHLDHDFVYGTWASRNNKFTMIIVVVASPEVLNPRNSWVSCKLVLLLMTNTCNVLCLPWVFAIKGLRGFATWLVPFVVVTHGQSNEEEKPFYL